MSLIAPVQPWATQSSGHTQRTGSATIDQVRPRFSLRERWTLGLLMSGLVPIWPGPIFLFFADRTSGTAHYKPSKATGGSAGPDDRGQTSHFDARTGRIPKV
jgi:hypothetical protein